MEGEIKDSSGTEQGPKVIDLRTALKSSLVHEFQQKLQLATSLTDEQRQSLCDLVRLEKVSRQGILKNLTVPKKTLPHE